MSVVADTLYDWTWDGWTSAHCCSGLAAPATMCARTGELYGPGFVRWGEGMGGRGLRLLVGRWGGEAGLYWTAGI